MRCDWIEEKVKDWMFQVPEEMEVMECFQNTINISRHQGRIRYQATIHQVIITWYASEHRPTVEHVHISSVEEEKAFNYQANGMPGQFVHTHGDMVTIFNEYREQQFEKSRVRK